MAITTFTLLAKANRTNFQGTRTFTVPAGITRVNSIRIYTDTTNAGGTHTFSSSSQHLVFTAANSVDSGATWQDDFGFTADGGYINSRTGLPADPEATTYYSDQNRPAVGSQERLTITQTGTFQLGIFADVDHD